MKFTGWKLFCVSIALVVPFFAFAITRIVKSTQFDDNCTYHIDQALQSDDPKYSVAQADQAIQYMKDHKLTSGYTTIAGKSADEDVGLWYQAIMEKDNYLHTLQEASPDDLKKFQEYAAKRNLAAESTRVPGGISVFPHNVAFFVWELISLALAVAGVIGIIVFINEKSSV